MLFIVIIVIIHSIISMGFLIMMGLIIYGRNNTAASAEYVGCLALFGVDALFTPQPSVGFVLV